MGDSTTTAATAAYRVWLDQVLRTRDNDLRAHRIAATYYELGRALDKGINGELAVCERLKRSYSAVRPNANWFHFALWGTLTVTRNIAHQRPPQRVDGLPTGALRRRLTPSVIQARAARGQRVGRALSWGQRLIFVSVCYSVEYLLRWMADNPDAEPDAFDPLGNSGPDGAAIDDILAYGRWDETEWIDADRHLRAVADALRFYVHAERTDDPTARAQCILGGNVLLTAVEQDLADPAIRAVVCHVPHMVVAGTEARAARWIERLSGTPEQVAGLNLPFRYPGARTLLDTTWSRLMTDQVLVMALPTETLRLGRDIPSKNPAHPFFPDDLRRLGAPPDRTLPAGLTAALTDVSALVNSFDRTVGHGRGSAARDWRRWDERMNWAVTLMRSRQQDETLHWSPYAEADIRRLERGELPLHSGDPSALEVLAPGDASPFAEFAADGVVA